MGAQYPPDSVGVSALPHGRVVLEGLAGVELAGGVVQVGGQPFGTSDNHISIISESQRYRHIDIVAKPI